MKQTTHTLCHYEGFEKVKKYHDIWDKIRYKKIYEIEQLSEKVINIFEKRIDTELLVIGDYVELQNLFKKMRIKQMSYMSGDARNIIEAINPKLKNLYKKKKCFRSLRYINKSNEAFTFDKIYQSKNFNGVTYTIIKDDNHRKVKINCGHFERIS